jgi:hypothetical protein
MDLLALTGALESHYYLKYGQMKLFAEQQLVRHTCNRNLYFTCGMKR